MAVARTDPDQEKALQELTKIRGGNTIAALSHAWPVMQEQYGLKFHDYMVREIKDNRINFSDTTDVINHLYRALQDSNNLEAISGLLQRVLQSEEKEKLSQFKTALKDIADHTHPQARSKDVDQYKNSLQNEVLPSRLERKIDPEEKFIAVVAKTETNSFKKSDSMSPLRGALRKLMQLVDQEISKVYYDAKLDKKEDVIRQMQACSARHQAIVNDLKLAIFHSKKEDAVLNKGFLELQKKTSLAECAKQAKHMLLERISQPIDSMKQSYRERKTFPRAAKLEIISTIQKSFSTDLATHLQKDPGLHNLAQFCQQAHAMLLTHYDEKERGVLKEIIQQILALVKEIENYERAGVSSTAALATSLSTAHVSPGVMLTAPTTAAQAAPSRAVRIVAGQAQQRMLGSTHQHAIGIKPGQ